MSNAVLERTFAVHIEGNRWSIVSEDAATLIPIVEAAADRFADLKARARRRAATRPEYFLESEAAEIHDTVVAFMPLQAQTDSIAE